MVKNQFKEPNESQGSVKESSGCVSIYRITHHYDPCSLSAGGCQLRPGRHSLCSPRTASRRSVQRAPLWVVQSRREYWRPMWAPTCAVTGSEERPRASLVIAVAGQPDQAWQATTSGTRQPQRPLVASRPHLQNRKEEHINKQPTIN